MDNIEILTVDGPATKDALKRDGRTAAAWARARGFIQSTVSLILAGKFPFQSNPESVYQQVLRALKKDGYLVEAPVENVAA